MSNTTRITVFTLSGLNETMDYRVVLFCLTLLCYCVIFLVNITIILTIILDENLHEPMYIFLCGLCLNGLYGTAGFYPKFLFDLLSYSHVISYTGCLLQVYVIYSSSLMDFSILAVMAYDRYVAICRPLEYHSVMTKQTVSLFVLFACFMPLFCEAVLITLSSILELCNSHIDKLYCENWSIVKLSCTSTRGNNIAGYVVIVFYFGHFMFILCSYVHLIRSCVKSFADRRKFLQTCMPHVLCLLNVTITLLFDVMYTRYGSKDLPQTLQNFMALQFLVFPPILNSLVYGFQLTKVRNRILSLCNNQKINKAFPKVAATLDVIVLSANVRGGGRVK